MAELLVDPQIDDNIRHAAAAVVSACERGDIDAACAHGDDMMELVRRARRRQVLSPIAELRRALDRWESLKDAEAAQRRYGVAFASVLTMRAAALEALIKATREVLA